jgi:hypothetical protein
LENVIIKFVADTSGLEPAIKQLELLGKISKDDAAAFAQVNNEQKEFIQNLNKSTTEMGKLSNEVDGLMAEIQAGVMEGFADHLAEVTKETKQAGGGFKSMKQELKELKAQISSGSLGEKELREATKRAAELTDTIGDVNDKVKALASDTKRIDAVVTAFRGIAAAASVAAGAASLFGSENEKLTKTLAQAQGAMALLQGVQELANIATTEGALRTYVLDGAQKAAAVSSRILGVTISASMAMATAGISILIAGLVYLVSTMDDTSESAKNMDEALAGDAEIYAKANDKRLQMMKDGLDKELLMNKQAHDAEIDELIKKFKNGELSQTAYHEAIFTEDELFLFNEQKIRDEYAKLEADAAKKAADQKLKNQQAANEKLAKDKEIAKNKALQAQLRQIRDEIANNELLIRDTNDVSAKINYYKEITRLRKAQIQIDENLTINEKIFNQQLLDEQQRAYEESFNKRTESDIEAFNEANELKMDVSLDWWQKYFDVEDAFLDEQERKNKARREEAIKEYTKLALFAAQTISDTIFTINQQNRDAETASILESLSERKDAELANKELTDAQRLQIEERYAQQEAEIKTRAWEAQKQASIAQAIMNGALAITNILATVPGGPLNPATIASLAAAAISTAAQVAVISNTQPPKFADGGMVGGQLHSNGGTLIEAERGEYVINRQSTSDYLPSLKVLNSGEVEPTFANNILTALANGTFDLAAQFQTKQSASSDGINYDKLDRIMAKHKSNLNVNIDEQGLTTFLLKENSRVEFRNKKMRYRA